MKKVLAALTISLSLAQMSQAQPVFIFRDGTVQTQAAEQTRELANFVGINEFEYIQVRKLNEARLLAIQEAEIEYEDLEIRELNVRDINRNFEKAILKHLDARQKKAYYQYKQNNKQTIFTASVH